MDPRGVSENVHKPFIDSLAAIQQTLNEWDELRHKVLAQIKSLRNLQEQLEAIERCRSKGSLGVLEDFPGIVERLIGKILVSQQRAIVIIERHRKSLSKLTSVVQNMCEQMTSLIIKAIGINGLKCCCHRTAEHFAICDYVNWADDIKHTVHTDWLEMRAELMKITAVGHCAGQGVDKDCLDKMYKIWEMGGARLQEICQYISYINSKK